MCEETVGRLLAGGGSRGLEDAPFRWPAPKTLRQSGDPRLELLGREFTRIEREINKGFDLAQTVGVDVDGHDRSAERAGNLCAETAHAADAHEDGNVFGPQS